MAETSVHKVNATSSPKGAMGQKYLACGVTIAMRLWEKVEPDEDDAPRERDYETVGYVISGRAELHLGGQKLILEPGDSPQLPIVSRPTRRPTMGSSVNCSEVVCASRLFCISCACFAVCSN